MYDFNKVINRLGTGSIKWDLQKAFFGVENGLLPFWIADSDFETLPEVVQAVRKRCEHPLFGYTAPTGNYLKSVQDWYGRRHDWQIENSWIVPSIGVVTVMNFAIQVLTSINDRILVFTPSYDPFFKLIQNGQRVLVDCQLVRSGNGYEIDFEDFKQKLKEGVKLVIFCNPHNPVGKVWSYDDLNMIADLCARYRVYVLSDDVHSDITFFGHKYTPMGKFSRIKDLLVTYTAVSKTFNLAGLQSSNIIVSDAGLREKIVGALRNIWIMGPNTLALTAVEAAYTFGDNWVEAQNAYIADNSKFVSDFFEQYMPEIGITKHEGTYLMWLDFSFLKLSSRQISEIMVGEYKLALGIGSNYGQQADGFMRLNIACPRVTLEAGVDLIHRFYLNQSQKVRK